MRAICLLLSLLGAAVVPARASDESASANAAAATPALKAGVFEPARAAPAFTLPGSDGQPLTLERFRGKVVVLGFGFTNCPDVCPVTLSTLAAAHKKLGDDAKDVQVVYITVDPERDTATRMKKYLDGFNPAFVGGTGSDEQLASVRKEYGIAAEKKLIPGTYLYGHSSFTYLIDRAGRLRALMPYGHPAEDYVHDLRVLLAP